MRRYGAGMATSLARRAHRATESLHSMIYFVPETERELTDVGLRPGRMCYFAGRSAPMGAVSAGVVAATFYNFSPGLDWPDAPHLVMWHAVSLLREYRGDGHLCALACAGLSGLEALVTHSATGKGFLTEFARTSRGWSQEEWDGAVRGLADRGLLDGQGALTEAGQALRAEIEDQTDRLATPPWQHLGEQRTEDVVRIGKAMSRAVAAAGAFPGQGVFTAAR